MYKHLNPSNFLLFIFFITTFIGCGANSSLPTEFLQNQNYAEYEYLEFWTLRSNENTTIFIDDSISYDGDFSLKIINNDTNDLILTPDFPVVANEDYEINFTVLRPESDIEKKAGVSVNLYDDLIAVVKQADNVIMSEPVTINANDTWETKLLSFRTESDEPIEVYFMLGPHLHIFWLDNLSINSIVTID